MEERCGKRHSIGVERFPALLFPGTVVTAGQTQECELAFYMTGTARQSCQLGQEASDLQQSWCILLCRNGLPRIVQYGQRQARMGYEGYACACTQCRKCTGFFRSDLGSFSM